MQFKLDYRKIDGTEKGSLVGVEYESEQDAVNGILSGLGEGFEIIKIEEM